jgi:hypothetical protein
MLHIYLSFSGVKKLQTFQFSDCGDVQTINNGSITLDQPGATKYLATATVACDPGFNKTIASIKCQANGKWMDAFCVIEGRKQNVIFYL